VSWEVDARHAGQAEKNRKPYIAMLIARCVVRSDNQAHVKIDMKTSAQQFSEESGIATNTVKRYLDTWNALADAGEVPSPAEMEPGEDVELPDRETWRKWYRECFPAVERAKVAEELLAPNTDSLIEAAAGRQGQKLFDSARSAASNVPGIAGDQLRRLVESLMDMATDDDPRKAWKRSLHAIGELATALRV
jgi:hypothetical protein